MVDAVNRGPHSTWPSVVLSDQPLSDAHENKPGINSPPRNGVEIDFNAGCGQATIGPEGGAITDYPQSTVGEVSLFNNYSENDWTPQTLGPVACVNAQADHPNLILLQYSQTSLDVWMADDIANMQPGMPMTPPTPKHVLHLDQSNGFNLNMTRGYVSFQQAQYFGAKFNGTSERTYHWHAVGFDGPALVADRDYEVPDSLGPRSDGTRNIGYSLNGSTIGYCCPNGGTVTVPSFTLKNVDLTGVTSAYVAFNWREDNTVAPNLQVRLNGNAWRPVVLPPGAGFNQTTNALAAIPVSDLRSGDNTLEFNTSVGGAIANIDLALDPVAGGASSTTTSSSTSSMTMSSSTSTSSVATSSTSTTTSTASSQTRSTTTTTSTSVAKSSTTTTTASATSTSTSSARSATSTTASTTSTVGAPTFAISAKLSHYMQYPGQNVSITATVQDLTGSLGNGLIQVQVIGANGTPVFTQTAQVHNFGAGQTETRQFTWTTPNAPGTYTVRITVYASTGAPVAVNQSAGTVRVIPAL